MSKRDFITNVVIANSKPDELVNLALAYLEELEQDDTQEWAMLFVAGDLLQCTDIEDNILEITCSELPQAEETTMTFGDFARMYAASVLLDDQSRRMDIFGKIIASMPQLITHINDAAFLMAAADAAGFSPGDEENDDEVYFKHEERLERGEEKMPKGSHLRLVPKPGEEQDGKKNNSYA
jgi:hypothetical protein